MSDDDKEILEDVRETLHAHGYKDYDELRNAVESKRMLRELHGLSRARWTSWIASFGAAASAIAAVATVWILLDRSQFEEENTYNELVSREKVLFEGQRAEAKKALAQAVLDRDEILAEVERLQTAIADLQAKRNELNAEITRDNQNLRSLRDLLADASKKINEQARTSSEEGVSLEDRHKSLESLKLLHASENRKAQDKISDLTSRLAKLDADLRGRDASIQRLTTSAEQLGKLAYGGFVQGPLVYRGTEVTLKSATDNSDLYRITLTNVGNIKENVDLEIVAISDGSSSNLVNLDRGAKYVAKFNQELFLIEVQEAIRSDVRAEEQGRFAVTLLRNEYQLVY